MHLGVRVDHQFQILSFYKNSSTIVYAFGKGSFLVLYVRAYIYIYPLNFLPDFIPYVDISFILAAAGFT